MDQCDQKQLFDRFCVEQFKDRDDKTSKTNSREKGQRIVNVIKKDPSAVTYSQGCRRPADLSGRPFRPTFQADLSGRTFWPDLQAGTRPERPLIKDVVRLLNLINLNNIITRLYYIF